ncbi:MAG: hypothetical protein JJU34_08905 [Lunatimonas sp.]|uniref:hypothetical protein n=1 Tax=Lunatimonas sp. TaxID=2060141 RepID=UPI00263B26B9|nr:hypothetical protein [Lunatimonas sp.]MCC5937387.1 hypothetical protein [Lunatimonas sp.]
MKINYLKKLSILILITFSLGLVSCEDDDTLPESFNASFLVNDTEFNAIGEFLSIPSGFDDLHVTSFEFTDKLNITESTFLIGISRYDSQPWEPSTGLYSMRNSYLAGGETGRFGAGVTWWDENRQATIYSELDRGFIRIREVTDTRISGDFEFTLTAPETGAELRVVEGRFNLPR